MPDLTLPESRDELVAELTARASKLWGRERADALRDMIEEHADHLLALSQSLPPSEEAPVMTWQSHP